MVNSKNRVIVLALAVVFIAFGALELYSASDRVVEHAERIERIGTLEAIHQRQNELGARTSVFYVRISPGEVVHVNPPELTPFTHGARVRVIEGTTKSGRKQFAFGGYVSLTEVPAK